MRKKKRGRRGKGKGKEKGRKGGRKGERGRLKVIESQLTAKHNTISKHKHIYGVYSSISIPTKYVT